MVTEHSLTARHWVKYSALTDPHNNPETQILLFVMTILPIKKMETVSSEVIKITKPGINL